MSSPWFRRSGNGGRMFTVGDRPASRKAETLKRFPPLVSLQGQPLFRGGSVNDISHPSPYDPQPFDALDFEIIKILLECDQGWNPFPDTALRADAVQLMTLAGMLYSRLQVKATTRFRRYFLGLPVGFYDGEFDFVFRASGAYANSLKIHVWKSLPQSWTDGKFKTQVNIDFKPFAFQISSQGEIAKRDIQEGRPRVVVEYVRRRGMPFSFRHDTKPEVFMESRTDEQVLGLCPQSATLAVATAHAEANPTINFSPIINVQPPDVHVTVVTTDRNSEQPPNGFSPDSLVEAFSAEAKRVLDIAKSNQSANDRMRQILDVDASKVKFTSKEWSELLRVSDSAVRETEVWKTTIKPAQKEQRQDVKARTDRRTKG